MGVPDMEAFWNDLSARKQAGKLGKTEEKFFKKWVKALGCLSSNPRHNSLASHEIEDLSRKHGIKIFQSYFENKTPAAGRMFWAYGPGKGDITVLAVEPHPEDEKRGAYERIKPASLPPRDPKLCVAKNSHLSRRLRKGVEVKRVRIGSAAMAAVTYDEEERTLDVEFRGGDTYRYMHVPEFVYRELLKAESAGVFWNSIKDQFEYVKLE